LIHHLRTRYLLFAVICIGFCLPANSQVQVKGTVYDVTQRNPLMDVTVLSSSGRAAVTDSFGHYSLVLESMDSIHFSYLGKPTKPVAVKDIPYPWDFNMSLHVTTGMLPSVIVRPRSFRYDSMQNRMTYSKVFDFQKPNPLSTINSSPSGVVGMDPNAIINMFRFRRNRRMLAFQERLVQQEQDKYVDHRYNKAIVKRLTGLDKEELDAFMVRYRPDYDFVQSCNDLELFQYIWSCSKQYETFRKRSINAIVD